MLIHPRHWLSWLVIGIMFILAWLPQVVQKLVAHILGTLLFIIDAKHRKICHTNLSLCFPNMDKKEKDFICKKCFRYVFYGIIIMSTTWFGSKKNMVARVVIHGEEHVHDALNKKRSVFLIGLHQMFVEVLAVVFEKISAIVIYRKNPNLVFESMLYKGRTRYMNDIIPSRSIKDIVKMLNKPNVYWITADQDSGRRSNVFSTLFGVTASTVTTIPRLAKIANGIVLSVSVVLEKDNNFHIYFSEPVTMKPEQSLQTNVDIMNQAIEKEILRCPEQYLWLHKRFKTQPNGVPSPYK